MSAPIKTQIAGNKSLVSEDTNEIQGRNGKPTGPPVVRTLKPPPEIWELVHPVPTKEFKPGRAFVTRLASSGTNLILLAGALVLISSVFTGVLRLRSAQRSPGVITTQAVPAKRADSTSGVSGVSDMTRLSPKSPAPEVDATYTQPTVSIKENLSRTTSRLTRRTVRVVAEVQQPDSSPGITETTRDVRTDLSPRRPQHVPPTDQGVKIQPLISDTESDKKGSTDSSSAKRTSNSTLSPELIASPKRSPARQAKIIQWP